MSDKPTNRIALERSRDEAIELISNRFAEGILNEEELDERLEGAAAATTLEELGDLTEDIRDPEAAQDSVAIVPVEAAPLAAADDRDAPRAVAVFGENELKGAWTAGRVNRGVAVFGESTFDFREAQLQPGVTTVRITAVMGQVNVIVPPDLPVQSSCVPILGSVELDETISSGSADPDAPRLLLTGKAILGSIEVQERLPGETRRDAKRRLRQRRKQLKAARKAARKQLESAPEAPLLTDGKKPKP